VKEWVNGAEIKRNKCAKLFANKSMLVAEGSTHLNKPIKTSSSKVVIKKIELLFQPSQVIIRRFLTP
jgi:hypothetical protein